MTLGQTTAVAMALVSAMALGIWISPFVLSPATGSGAWAASAEPPAASSTGAIAAVPVTSPALHERLQPLLNRGARMPLAADGFESAEQFAAVAYAAHNTRVPFTLLKHRVLEQKMTLADAIRESNVPYDADVEADRARAEARSVIAALSATT